MQTLKLLRSDFTVYAPACLKVKKKSGKIVPFVLNDAQKYIHGRLEEQLQRTGKIRALILKGRQQGCSTLIEGRFYWKVTGSHGRKAFILTHHSDATKNLFGMARRYHNNCPPEMQPSTSKSNARELVFDLLDSGYQVATAGAAGAGRSDTAQYFHGSEVAFWPQASTHMTGAMQIIPNEPGTEVILETTANGVGGVFYEMWQAAERGQGEFIAIFVPWFWQREYRLPVPRDFELTDKEVELQELYGLDLQQVAWRRAKINDEFTGDEAKFRQEYPCNPLEAFITSGDSFIKAERVVAAQKPKPIDPRGPLVIGVDPARFGNNNTSIIRRRGRVAYGLESINGDDGMAVAGRIVRIILDEKPDRVFIDSGGIGGPIYDRLVELGYADIVTPVGFGESAYNEARYINRRVEMYGECRDWLVLKGGVVIPDAPALLTDLCGPQYSYSSRGQYKLETKEDMRKRGVPSPDNADALVLTFAEPVGVDESPREAPPKDSWRSRLDKLAKMQRKQKRSAMSR